MAIVIAIDGYDTPERITGRIATVIDLVAPTGAGPGSRTLCDAAR